MRTPTGRARTNKEKEWMAWIIHQLVCCLFFPALPSGCVSVHGKHGVFGLD